MSTDRDITRIVQSWLEEGVTALPDRVLDTVLDQVPATPQRRSWWPPRRSAKMNRFTQAAIATAAVLVVAVVGYNVMPRTARPGGPPTAAPTASPTAVQPLTMTPALAVAPGTYLISDETIVPFTVTVPEGWAIDAAGFLSKSGDSLNGAGAGVAFSTWKITHVYHDSCNWTGTLQATGSRESLATALAAQKGHTTSVSSEVTLGGQPATQLQLSLAADFPISTCDGGANRLWPDPGPDETGGWRIRPGQTTTVYLQEFQGRAQAALAVVGAAASSADRLQLQALVESIQFQE
jgi:hypothetical protein